MSERFSIELSDDVVQRATQAAQRTGHSIEDVLSEWIERSAAADELYPLIPGVEYPIYTPVGSEAAAAVLVKFLD